MNWFNRSKPPIQSIPKGDMSILYNEDTFYNQFVQDLRNTQREVLIESPYITKKRLDMLKPTFEILIAAGVHVCVITKAPQEHDAMLSEQSEAGIRYFERIGVQVLLIKGGHHRKLAMIDRNILWEGSLNILSQYNSREFMRRIDSHVLTEELFRFLKFDTLQEFSV